MTSSDETLPEQGSPPGPVREVPVDWEALEDAFENNAPEVHSYLHLSTGDVLRVVDGVADPQMHARINNDSNYLRIAPVSSREQYRWMERYIPLVEDPELQSGLAASIDGKGAFRRFKDVLMSHAPEREQWFVFRSERLRTFMEAWLTAHALKAVARPAWAGNGVLSPEAEAEVMGEEPPSSSAPVSAPLNPTEARETRRARSAEGLRKHLRDVGEVLGSRDLETLVAFGEFLKARRISRAFMFHQEASAHELPNHAEDAPPVSSEQGAGRAALGAQEDPLQGAPTPIRPTGSEGSS